jgi:hypothetical protein
MSMIGDERPCETTGLRLGDNITKPFNEIVPDLDIIISGNNLSL